MRQVGLLIAFAVLLPLTVASQAPPSVPLGAGRTETPGIKRTQLRDDSKATVTRVQFDPNAAEPPHTHPYDVLLVPVLPGTVRSRSATGDSRATRLARRGAVRPHRRDAFREECRQAAVRNHRDCAEVETPTVARMHTHDPPETLRSRSTMSLFRPPAMPSARERSSPGSQSGPSAPWPSSRRAIPTVRS